MVVQFHRKIHSHLFMFYRTERKTQANEITILCFAGVFTIWSMPYRYIVTLNVSLDPDVLITVRQTLYVGPSVAGHSLWKALPGNVKSANNVVTMRATLKIINFLAHFRKFTMCILGMTLQTSYIPHMRRQQVS